MLFIAFHFSPPVTQNTENIRSPDADDCHVIVNDKSTEFMLATVVEETSK